MPLGTLLVDIHSVNVVARWRRRVKAGVGATHGNRRNRNRRPGGLLGFAGPVHGVCADNQLGLSQVFFVVSFVAGVDVLEKTRATSRGSAGGAAGWSSSAPW